MHSVNLLVADKTPESAEHINSMLRNSGIKVRVIHADSSIGIKRALDNVRPRLEVKSRRVGGATYQVPMEVPAERQYALAMRWLVTFAAKRKAVPMKEALAIELKDAAAGQGNAIKKRDDMHKMAQANRAFAHFRW